MLEPGRDGQQVSLPAGLRDLLWKRRSSDVTLHLAEHSVCGRRGWCRGEADLPPGRRLGSLLLQAWLVPFKALTLQSLWKVQKKVSTRVWGVWRQLEMIGWAAAEGKMHAFKLSFWRKSQESVVLVWVPAIIWCLLCEKRAVFWLAGRITDTITVLPLVGKKGSVSLSKTCSCSHSPGGGGGALCHTVNGWFPDVHVFWHVFWSDGCKKMLIENTGEVTFAYYDPFSNTTPRSHQLISSLWALEWGKYKLSSQLPALVAVWFFLQSFCKTQKGKKTQNIWNTASVCSVSCPPHILIH